MPQPEHSPSPLDDTAFLAAYDRAWQRFQADPTPHNQSLLRTGEQFLIRELQKPGKFELGRTVAIPCSVRTHMRH